MREGSIRKDPQRGTWTVVVDVPAGEGKRRQLRRRGFRTKADALEALDQLRADLRAGTWRPPTKDTFGQYLTAWGETRAAAGLKPSTVASYRMVIEKRVCSSPIADVPLQALTGVDLDKLWSELLESGGKDGKPLSARTVRYTHSIVRKALADAVRKHLLARNPADDADPPRSRAAAPPRPTIWTPEDLATFLDKTKDHHHGALFRVAGMTGLRRAELCGLRWANVDLDRQTITVVDTITTVDHERVEGTPKSERSVRVLDIDEQTVAVLRRHRKAQLEQRMKMGSGFTDRGLVFAMPDGTAWHPDVVGRAFSRAVTRSKLPRIRLHDLRHSHATHLLAADVNVKVVSERLGHSSVAFTLSVYAHVMPGQQADAAAAVAALVDGRW